MPALVMIACAATIVGLLASAVLWGVPSGVADIWVTALVVASIVFIHQLVVHVLPVSSESDEEPGISEEGWGYEGSPISVYGLRRINIHLGRSRSHRHEDGER